MSTKPETTFTQSVHKHIPGNGPYYMKNHNQYVGGIPDVWYSGKNNDLWIEYKFITVPARATTMIDPCAMLSQLQQDWLRCRLLEGRDVGVIVGCKAGGVLMLAESWTRPLTTEEFLTRVQTRTELAHWINMFCGPRHV